MMTHPRRLMCVVLIAISCMSGCTIAEIQAHIGRNLTASERSSHQLHNGHADNRELGHQMALNHGWSEAQWECLDFVIMRESAWDHTAKGPTNDLGIPQASPGSKMASAGADYRTNPVTQIRWLKSYMVDRYGDDPCRAKATKVRSGIY